MGILYISSTPYTLCPPKISRGFMAAGGHFGDAAGGCSSGQRSQMAGRSAPPLRPPRGRSLSSRGGFSAARAAMMRCAHGRLAQRLRTGRAVVAMGVGRKRSGERRMTAVTVLQRRSAGGGCLRPTGTREPGPGKAARGPFGVSRHAAQWRKAATVNLEIRDRACARAPSVSCVKWVRQTLYSM